MLQQHTKDEQQGHAWSEGGLTMSLVAVMTSRGFLRFPK